MPSLQTVLEDFAKRRRLYQIMYIAYAACIVLAFALSFVDQRLGIALALTDIAFLLLGLSPLLKQYRRAFTAQSVRFGICKGMEAAQYTGKPMFTKADLDACAILPPHDGEVLQREGFCAHDKGLAVRANEISLHYRQAGAKRDYRFWSGTLVDIAWQDAAGPGFALLSEGRCVPPVLERLAAAGLTAAPFKADGKQAAYTLFVDASMPAQQRGALERRLRALCSQAPRDLALYSSGQGLTAFYSGVFYTTNLKVRTRITEEILCAPRLVGLDALLALAAWCRGTKA